MSDNHQTTLTSEPRTVRRWYTDHDTWRRLSEVELMALPPGSAVSVKLDNGLSLAMEKRRGGAWITRKHTLEASHLAGLMGADRLPATFSKNEGRYL